MSEKQAKCIFSIEIFDDNIIVLQCGEKKQVAKIKNPLALLPLFVSLLVIPFGTEKVKEIESWLDHVWIKRIKKSG